MQSHLRKCLPVLAMTASTLFALPSAQAAFVMTLDDPNDSLSAITIYDGTGSDLNGVNGVITYSGAVGAFVVNVTTGVSKPLIGPAQLDLNSINVSGAAGTLLVSISDTGFTGNYNTLGASYGGTTQGAVDFDFLYDTANQQFGGNAFAADSFISSGVNYAFSDDLAGAVTPAALFSLSINTRITHDSAFEVTSFDAQIAPVPLPATIWLLGAALAGLASLRRARHS
ncbi:MAG: VPLPA-CTERM sorting domain-containing protein [Gammaproteobacteria bacterium]|nr:VPLPA-CTERM sorting domain-containing protein [Gammaproteobacteria bacterium]